MLVHESEVTLADTRNRRLFWGPCGNTYGKCSGMHIGRSVMVGGLGYIV